MENEGVKVLWDFSIQVRKFIETRQPDLNKAEKNKKNQQDEKIGKHQVLKRQIL